MIQKAMRSNLGKSFRKGTLTASFLSDAQRHDTVTARDGMVSTKNLH